MTFIAQLPAMHRTQIELQEKDGSLVELSKASQLVAALAGQNTRRPALLFPKRND